MHLIKKVESCFKKEGYFIGLLAFVILLIILSPFNHKELFLIFRWNVFPARIVLSFFYFLGLTAFIIFKKDLLDILFFLFSFLSIFIFISTIKSFNYFESILYGIFYATFPFLYLVIKVLFIHYKDKFILFFLLAYIISALFSSLIQFYQMYIYFNKGILFGAIWPLKDRFPRFGSLFWDVNHFALFMVISFWLVLIYTHILYSRVKNKYILYFSSFMLILSFLSSLFFSFSRSSFLGLFTGIIVFVILKYLVFSKKLLIYIKYVPLLSFLFLIFIYYIPFRYLLPLRFLFVYRSESFFSHFRLLSVGFYLFTKSPLLGIGVGNFTKSLTTYPLFHELAFLDPSVLQKVVPLHSVWIQFLVESGIFSFVSFLLISFFTIHSLFKTYKKTHNSIYALFLGSFISLLISGIFYSYNLEFFWVYFIFVVTFSYYKLDFKKSFFGKFISTVANKKTLSSVFLTSIFLWGLLYYLTLYPSLREIQTFNFAKRFISLPPLSIDNFYFSFLRKFQFMLGYYPYVGRFASFVFALLGFLNIYLTFKHFFKQNSYALSFSLLLLGLFTFFRFFDISVLSFYFLLFSFVIYLLSFVFSYPISFKFISPLKILYISLFIIFVSYTPYFFKPFMPNISYLANLFSQRYSLIDFNVSSDIPNSRELLIFYTEPKLKIFTKKPLKSPFVYFTNNSNLDIFYHSKIKKGDIYMYVNFSDQKK